ncbi:hypothetical protein [Streptomyces nigrescens]|uniref:Uncharacterized protein n=1 Tax=Streptomyces nigrescens TaxID=1920 RepID=A0A640T9P4_STRNI|nr:hypothetical protein [Streptomyces libani]WAT94900.1 hypothetical protein STRLI_000572 [Streptomyces libani subsp. libani]GFE20048.1 hypothetical protein Sliba_05010 [Streptomyces libani subsp. libani]GGV85667.1 hypothetical protein GCM10010500_02540 [Streptomyces libani subsp. libani]
MNLKESATDSAAQALAKVFEQLDNGGTNPADVRAANGAMDVAAVFGVTADDYARLLRQH